MRVTNTTDFPLTLPTGLTIAAGKTRPVRGWDTMKLNPTVKAWLRAGALAEADQPKPKRTRKAKPVEETADEA